MIEFFNADEISELSAFVIDVGGKVSESTSRYWYSFTVGESWYAVMKRRGSGFSIEGSHIPVAANARYGVGKLRRAKLANLLRDVRPYVRTKNAHEAAVDATEKARNRWNIGRRHVPARDDSALMHAYVMGEPGVQSLMDDRLAEIDEWVLKSAASEGVAEMWNHFDDSLR